tara:strand:- start:273 stop:494 length:222 start_codon:yes stop_codon:yes gene_type:complete
MKVFIALLGVLLHIMYVISYLDENNLEIGFWGACDKGTGETDWESSRWLNLGIFAALNDNEDDEQRRRRRGDR